MARRETDLRSASGDDGFTLQSLIIGIVYVDKTIFLTSHSPYLSVWTAIKKKEILIIIIIII